MGNDGGTIAKRKDLISLHSLNDSAPKTGEDNESTLLVTCGISSLPLDQGPVVGDWKGQLYLKEKALEHILEHKSKRKDESGKSSENQLGKTGQPQLKSLNDVVDIKITWGEQEGSPVLICPVTKEGNTRNFTYAYLRPCGCLLSYKVLQELGKSLKVGKEPVKSECPNCGSEFHYNYDIVILNPLNIDASTKFNLEGLRYLEQQGLTHSKKKLRKRSTRDENSKNIKKKRLN
ncbi:uncharacterized protein CANTADRAFT_107162 [Suhomyces tanzawaensis NRRL Y-17324]|uniref:Uncharacterized protein n=1 Tax=Suhomyces tanzawaensis NRRL Y-17324 TaxID=984487 RepID=A0A1E4SPI7_9ASCO|nr:uncharacterized protein CANTADRAFT_107162 [Suhomyces tanzawaensis NRRL Y-17324]ODV81406.1 hypothetical protein CANTADRAFT_107162 [Suhomyces tanzawaensis NRRL Y-17324]